MTKEELIDAFNTDYPFGSKDDDCIYCNKPIYNIDKRQIGKRYNFPYYLLKGITTNRFKDVPVHYMCVENVLNDLQEINGGADNGKNTKFIIC